MHEEVEAVPATPKRTIEEINKEYRELCAQSGELAYLVKIRGEDIIRIQQRMYALNQEAKDAGIAAVVIPDAVKTG